MDVACGAGRLLVPYVEAGLDVDGCDVSPDMLAYCAQAAEAVGASPNLHCQAMHELDLPRRYRTVFVCGGLGLGSTREQDQQALRRLYEHLEPGGRLVLDNEVPYSDAGHWGLWPSGRRGGLPEPEQLAHRWHKGTLVAEERHRLTSNLYFCAELVMMIEHAGFSEVEVRGEYNDAPPTADDSFLVYVATRT